MLLNIIPRRTFSTTIKKKISNIIICPKGELTLKQETYNAFVADILKWTKKEHLTLYNKPNRVTTAKGILVRQGKGNGKPKSKVTLINENNPLAVLRFEDGSSLLDIMNNIVLRKYPFLKLFVEEI
jgi:hypothetical protein